MSSFFENRSGRLPDWPCGARDLPDSRVRCGKAVFNVTAMERSILAELSERGGRSQFSGLKDRRPIERLVNKGFVERHTLNSQQEEQCHTSFCGRPLGDIGVEIAAVARCRDKTGANCEVAETLALLPLRRVGRENRVERGDDAGVLEILDIEIPVRLSETLSPCRLGMAETGLPGCAK
jgi:hypothetical protein